MLRRGANLDLKLFLRGAPVISQSVRTKTWKDVPPPDPELYEKTRKRGGGWMERETFPGQFDKDPPKGKIADKLPFKITLEAGKKYAWCTCGHSKSQPICDGAHKRLDGTSIVKTKPLFRPHRFYVEDTKEYWLCNCKQTGNRPFCDGTHVRQDIQDAIRS